MAKKNGTIPEEFVRARQDWFDISDLAKQTQTVYSHAVELWLKTAQPWSSGWEKRTMAWADGLNDRSLKTKSVYVGAARAFLGYLLEEGIVSGRRNPLNRVKIRKVQSSGIKRRALTDPEVQAMLASCDRATALGLRDYCIIKIMVYTALRIAAVAGIMVEDFFESNGRWYVVYQAKGQRAKQRNKPLNPTVVRSVEEYLKATGRRFGGKGPFLLAWGKTALSTAGIRKMLKRRFRICEITDRTVSVHSLRHTAATKAMEQGIDLKKLQIFMDHESLTTTDGYVHERQSLASLDEFEISYNEEDDG